MREIAPAYQPQSSKQYQPHTVQISGLDKSKAPNIKDINDKFGTVGNIKKSQYGQASIRCRPDDGLVTVEYEAASSVESAIKWFNESEFDGSIIKVEIAPQSSPDVSSVQTAEPPKPNGPPGPVPGHPPPHMAGPPHPHHPPPMAFGYGPPPPHFGHHHPPGGGMHPPRPNVPPRPGDWDCVHCGNSNFQFRQECRRCKVPRDEAEKGKISPEKAASGAAKMQGGRGGPRHPYRPPGPHGFNHHHGFPPRGPPFMRGPHPGMRPPFMGAPHHGHRPHFFPPRMGGHRGPYTGQKRKQPYHASSSDSNPPPSKEVKGDTSDSKPAPVATAAE